MWPQRLTSNTCFPSSCVSQTLTPSSASPCPVLCSPPSSSAPSWGGPPVPSPAAAGLAGSSGGRCQGAGGRWCGVFGGGCRAGVQHAAPAARDAGGRRRRRPDSFATSQLVEGAATGVVCGVEGVGMHSPSFHKSPKDLCFAHLYAFGRSPGIGTSHREDPIAPQVAIDASVSRTLFLS